LHAVIVSGLVTAVSYALPEASAATGVGFAFLAAAWWLVLRRDADAVRHYALSLGGVLEPAPIEWGKLAKSAAGAALFALAVTAIIFPPFVIGFRIYWRVGTSFHLRLPPSMADELLGQLLVIAIPEEAFYRGYLQTALDDRWGTGVTLFGAKVGWGLVASSAIFAAGHFLTEPHPARLAVFFPALLFGWMRARSGGIGAPAIFHAACNVFASTLARGYGFAS
jgi:membrane protease YdiL (CAAX protease family)